MDGPKQGGTPLAPRLLGAMTPCTKIRTAKDFILEAKVYSYSDSDSYSYCDCPCYVYSFVCSPF